MICNQCNAKFEATATEVPPSVQDQKDANKRAQQIVRVKCRECGSTDVRLV